MPVQLGAGNARWPAWSEFDEGVLNAAVQYFWKLGYEGISVEGPDSAHRDCGRIAHRLRRPHRHRSECDVRAKTRV
jgi:hypothetical protein